MAENKDVIELDQIERNNPFDDTAEKAQQQAQQQAMDEQAAQAFAQSQAKEDLQKRLSAPIYPSQVQQSNPPTGPLNTQQYAQQQIQSIESRKGITATEAANLSEGQLANAEINKRAAEEHQKSIEQSRLAMQQAIADANKRDDLLRQQIREAAARKINPENWWETRSTGQKVLAGIGMFLGALGGGIAKTGVNPAMTVINRAIDEDISSQRQSIEDNWKAIASQHGLDESSFNRELHRQTWENNYRTAGLEKVKLELADAAARTQSVTVKQNALMGIQDLTDQQAKIRNQQYVLGQQALLSQQARLRQLAEKADKDYQELVKEKGVSPEAAAVDVYGRPVYRELVGAGLVPSSYGNAQVQKLQLETDIEKSGLVEKALKRQKFMMSSGLTEEQANEAMAKDPAFAPLLKLHQLQQAGKTPIVPADQADALKLVEFQTQQAKDERERAVIFNGKRALAPSKETAEAFRKDLDHISHANALIQELINERTNSGGGELSRDKTALMIGKRNQIINEINELSGVNRLNEKEIELVESMLPEDPNAWNTFWRANPTLQLENAKQILNTKIGGSYQSLIQSTGGQTGPTTTGTGGGPRIQFTPTVK